MGDSEIDALRQKMKEDFAKTLQAIRKDAAE